MSKPKQSTGQKMKHKKMISREDREGGVIMDLPFASGEVCAGLSAGQKSTW